MFGCQKVRLVFLLKLVVSDLFSTKTHERITITVHIIACMDHFVIGEPTSMIHSVTAM
jgi:hypothetical protein